MAGVTHEEFGKMKDQVGNLETRMGNLEIRMGNLETGVNSLEGVLKEQTNELKMNVAVLVEHVKGTESRIVNRLMVAVLGIVTLAVTVLGVFLTHDSSQERQVIVVPPSYLQMSARDLNSTPALKTAPIEKKEDTSSKPDSPTQ